MKIIEVVKELRLNIDGLSQLVDELKSKKVFDRLKYIPPHDTELIYKKIKSNEINKSYDSLILGKAWLGEVLKVLGDSDPYKNTEAVKAAAEINDTLEYPVIQLNLTKPIGSSTREMTYTEKIDWIREQITLIIEQIPSKAIMLQSQFSLMHLTEAKFWLGFELQRIREENY